MRLLDFLRTALGKSILLHLLIILLLVVNIHSFTSSTPQATMASAQKVIVHAKAITEKQVERQVNAVKQRKQAIQDKARRHKVALAKAKRLKQQRLAAKKRKIAKKKKAKKEAKARKKAQEKAKAKKKREKILAEKKKKQQEKERALQKKKQHQQQEKLLQDQLQAEQKELASSQQRQWRTVLSHYKTLITAAISSQWYVPEAAQQNMSCQFLIRLAPGGTVLSVQLLRSSGNAAVDRSAQAAVYKASPLPVPKDATLFNQFREIQLTVRPQTVTAV